MKCLPLVERDLSIGKPSQLIVALTIFSGVIATVLTGLLQVEIAFTAGVVTMILAGVLPVKDLYEHIDWPVIVLLGAMIPVGTAFETSGAADLVAEQILTLGTEFPLWMTIGLVMGPGGYKFGDYWRMGLPLDIIILLLATPLILLFWPA